MAKPSTLRLDEQIVKELRRLARERGVREDRDVSWRSVLEEGAIMVIEKERRDKTEVIGVV